MGDSANSDIAGTLSMNDKARSEWKQQIRTAGGPKKKFDEIQLQVVNLPPITLCGGNGNKNTARLNKCPVI